MSTPRQRDASIEAALLDGFAVTRREIDHARALQRRGHHDASIGELLVALEHLPRSELTATLAHLASAPVWSGEGHDASLLAWIEGVSWRAMPIRLEGDELLYATLDPLDPAIGERLRARLGARRGRHFTTDLATLARLAPKRPLAAVLQTAAFDPRAETLDEAALRARWSPDDRGRIADVDGVEVRLIDALLLDWAAEPGCALRIEAFDAFAVRRAAAGSLPVSFDEAVPLPRSIDRARLERCIWRVKHLAGAALGDASFEGMLFVVTPNGARTFRLASEATEHGRIATLQPHASWAGMGPPAEPVFDRWNERVEQAATAMREGRLADAVPRWRAALHEATQLGTHAVIERLGTLVELIVCLDRLERPTDALPFAEEALALVAEHELGARCAGAFSTLLAGAEVEDLQRRASLLARAADVASAPGPGRTWQITILIELAIVERCRGRHAEARAAAERARADDALWFGATTRWGFRALVESTLASAAIGDSAEAERSARDAARVASAIGIETGEADWALGVALGAADRTSDAVRCLERARAAELRQDDVPFVDLALARALERVGRAPDAVLVSRRALLLPMSGLHALARAELAAISQRGPYR